MALQGILNTKDNLIEAEEGAPLRRRVTISAGTLTKATAILGP
jgi:hypothetical protein